MKHFRLGIGSISSAVFILIIMTSSAAGQQTLGDIARQANKNKPAEPTTKVYTNDDLKAGALDPSYGSDQSSTADNNSNSTKSAGETTDDKTADGKDSKDEHGKEKKNKAKDADEQAKLDKEWQDKIAAQKDQIDLLQRELDVLQRENKQRATDYYADAGTRLRDEKKYAENDRKYHDEIDAKQKALDDAKTKLDEMREDARKAGASAGAIG